MTKEEICREICMIQNKVLSLFNDLKYLEDKIKHNEEIESNEKIEYTEEQMAETINDPLIEECSLQELEEPEDPLEKVYLNDSYL